MKKLFFQFAQLCLCLFVMGCLLVPTTNEDSNESGEDQLEKSTLAGMWGGFYKATGSDIEQNIEFEIIRDTEDPNYFIGIWVIYDENGYAIHRGLSLGTQQQENVFIFRESYQQGSAYFHISQLSLNRLLGLYQIDQEQGTDQLGYFWLRKAR